MRCAVGVAALLLVGCGSTTGTGDGGTGGGSASTGSGHFTYSLDSTGHVYRIEAKAGAVAEDVSAALTKFGSATRERWLIPSHDGAHLVLSTDRLSCSMGECLAVTDRAYSTLTLVSPGGEDVSLQGTPAITNAGDTVVYASQEGPHEVDLWVTKKSGGTWGAATLLTGSSSATYNNMPALTFDQQRVLFDCGSEPYPEGGNTDSCEVRLDGSGFKVVVTSTALPNARQTFTQFPRDSLDGVLFQGTWPIGGESPETIWLKGSGAPTPIGQAFTNAVSPCGLRDGRFGLLWLSREGNAAGVHELALADRTGKLVATLTPDVDVTDIGIGCSD